MIINAKIKQNFPMKIIRKKTLTKIVNYYHNIEKPTNMFESKKKKKNPIFFINLQTNFDQNFFDFLQQNAMIGWLITPPFFFFGVVSFHFIFSRVFRTENIKPISSFGLFSLDVS